MRESEYLKKNGDLTQKLRRVQPFCLFQKADFDALVRLSKIRHYSAGEKIISEGEQDSLIYFLILGDLQVTKKGKPLAVISQVGTIFGEMAIIDDSPRSASVYAASDAVCLACDVSHIDNMESHEKFRFGYFLYKTLAKFVADRLRTNSEMLTKENIDALHHDFLDTDIEPEEQLEDICDVPANHFLDDDQSDFYDPPEIFYEEDADSQDGTDDKSDNAVAMENHCPNDGTALSPSLSIVLRGIDNIINVVDGDIIGRQGTGSEILDKNEKISRAHARIVQIETQWYLEDLDSKNGTWLNGRKLEPLQNYRITDGDKIIFTNQKIRESSFTVEIK